MAITKDIKTAILTYGGGTLVSNKNIRNPHSFTITKSGYETYYQKQDITEKTNMTVTLKKQVPFLITDKGELLIKRNKANQGSGRNIAYKLVSK